MLGIIVSLLATLAALSFAFHSDDKQRYAESERRSTYRLSGQPAFRGETGARDKNDPTTVPGKIPGRNQ